MSSISASSASLPTPVAPNRDTVARETVEKPVIRSAEVAPVTETEKSRSLIALVCHLNTLY